MSIIDLPNSYNADGASEPRRKLKKAAAKLKDSASMMQDHVEDVAENARAYADRALEQINTLSRSALEKAKERPGLSALTILGVGVAIGAVVALALQQPAKSFADSALDEAGRLRRKLRR